MYDDTHLTHQTRQANMTVDELLNIPQLSQTSENTWKVDGLVIPKTWGQGRTAFGGYFCRHAIYRCEAAGN